MELYHLHSQPHYQSLLNMATSKSSCSISRLLTVLVFFLSLFGGTIQAIRTDQYYEPQIQVLLNQLLDVEIKKDPSKQHIKTLFLDESNDIETNLNLESIITRAGYKYEIYTSTSDDGYITQLYRLINPLAKRDKLKHTPVVFYGGQSVSPAVFLLASNNQHHPAPWPTDHHLPLGSNRSLAFMLSNNGYDVSV